MPSVRPRTCRVRARSPPVDVVSRAQRGDSRCRSCSPGSARSQSCSRSNASVLRRRRCIEPRHAELRSRFDLRPLAITRSSAIHHSRPVPSANRWRHRRPGRVEFAHHRQRKFAIVAIAVVEGEGGEAAREMALHQPPMQFVHADNVDIARAQMAQRGAQESGVDLEVPVRLERGLAGRPHVVQHENGADARQERAQQVVRPAEIERFQPGADDVVTELFHDRRRTRDSDST